MSTTIGEPPAQKWPLSELQVMIENTQKQLLTLGKDTFHPHEIHELSLGQARVSDDFFKESFIGIFPDKGGCHPANTVWTVGDQYRCSYNTWQIINELSIKNYDCDFVHYVRRGTARALGSDRQHIEFSATKFSLMLFGNLRKKNFLCLNPAFIDHIEPYSKRQTLATLTTGVKLILPCCPRTVQRKAKAAFILQGIFAENDAQWIKNPDERLQVALKLPRTPFVKQVLRDYRMFQLPTTFAEIHENLMFFYNRKKNWELAG